MCAVDVTPHKFRVPLVELQYFSPAGKRAKVNKKKLLDERDSALLFQPPMYKYI